MLHANPISAWRGAAARAAAILLTLAVVTVRVPAATGACRVDVSAMEAFWEVVDALQRDDSPSRDQWRSLLDTPGYNALYETEFEPAFFMECFSVAYSPSRRGELARSLHVGPRQHFFEHYRAVLRERAAVETAVALLDRYEVADRAAERAREFLPDDAGDGCPSAAVVVFDNGSRTHDTIVMDALTLLDTDPEDFFAHEFHHWYRNRIRALDMAALGETDRMAVAAIDLIQAEGVANFIDKELWVGDLGMAPLSRLEFAEDFVAAYDRCAQAVADIDSILAGFYRAPEAARAEIGGYLLAALPLRGHALGFYMARAVDEALGRKRLVSEVANPFAFFRSYDEAARQSGRPALSGEAMAAISMLEAKYVKR